MSSNWSANKPLAERERFASPLAICGLVGAALLLLVMLYPEKSLLKYLSATDVSTPAQLRYLEILVHVRSGDTDLVFNLARSYLAANTPDKAEQILGRLQGTLSPQQAKTAMVLRYEMRRQQMKALRPGDSRRPAAQLEYARQVEYLLQAGATPSELGRYLADAKKNGDSATSRRLEILLQKRAENGIGSARSQNSETITAESALARGDYRGAAVIQFKLMENAPHAVKRKYFMAGVRTLQSGNLLNEAVTEAEAHLGTLANDRETLIFLSRLALSANRPGLAQQYIRRALGMVKPGSDGV